MQVILRRNWFTPFGRFRASATKQGPAVEIPDALRARLPSDAVIVGEDHDYVEEAVNEPTTMSEAASAEGMDIERVAARAENALQGGGRKTTTQQIRANAIAFQKELDEEAVAAETLTQAADVVMTKAQKKAAQTADMKAHLPEKDTDHV